MRGLLPPAVLSQEVQAERVMTNLRNMEVTVQKVTYLMSLQERNERLFYFVMEHNIEELLPLLQYPAIGKYCLKYSLMFRSLPRGLFLSLADKGHIATIIKNWPERRVKAISLTDGESVGTLGDVGVQAIGIPISRLALFTALGGIDPSVCLPVTIDNGTDNENLLSDPIYVGVGHRRIKGEAYFELVDEFITAVRRRFGTSVIIDIDGTSWETQNKLLSTYRSTFPVYSDAHFGLPTLALAAIYAAQAATGMSLSDHRYVLVGESPVLTTVAELLEEAIQRESRIGTVLEARKSIYLVDSKGLIVRNRPDAEHLEDHKLPYIQDGPEYSEDLLGVIEAVKPSVLIGLSDGPPPFAFSENVLRAMSKHTKRPIILPMSLHDAQGTEGRGEVSAVDAYSWTDGRCFFADRHTNGPLTLRDGRTVSLTALNTGYVFPGVSLGALVSRVTRLREEMFVEVAKTLARLVPHEAIEDKGALLPAMDHARDIAAHVAATMSQKAYAAGVATELPKPHDLLETAYAWMYDAAYKRYR